MPGSSESLSNYISGDELIDAGLREFELLYQVREGERIPLDPQTGEPLKPPYIAKLESELEWLRIPTKGDLNDPLAIMARTAREYELILTSHPEALNDGNNPQLADPDRSVERQLHALAQKRADLEAEYTEALRCFDEQKRLLDSGLHYTDERVKSAYPKETRLPLEILSELAHTRDAHVMMRKTYDPSEIKKQINRIKEELDHLSDNPWKSADETHILLLRQAIYRKT